jgi:molybdopterin-guanine dinucleotide biosynthesis protein A
MVWAGGTPADALATHRMHGMDDDAVGIVLAGGRAERLAPLALGPGGKATLLVGGESCLGRVCAAIGTVVPRVLVVAAEGQPLPALDPAIEVVRDTAPNGGPLAGLRDGLAAAARGVPAPRVAFVGSCDVPRLAPAIVRLLLDVARSSSARFVVPLVGGQPQVLVSVVACDLAGEIHPFVAAGRGLRAVLADLLARQPATVRFVTADELAVVDPGLESFLDIDTPEDLARLETRGIPPSRG